MKVAFLLAAVCLIQTVSCDKLVFCYWGTWSTYRTGKGKFEFSNIDPQLCTHLGYTYFGINANGEIQHLDPRLNIDLRTIANTMTLKKRNTNLKILASVGGRNEGTAKYSSMAADPVKRKKFITSSVNLLRQYGFDGLDLDWEYPTAADRANYITLLRELRAALNPNKLLLTVAVAAPEATAKVSYDIPAMSQIVDFINVMTYNLQTPGKLSLNAPLLGSGPKTVSAAIQYWLRAGAPARKLVLGVPFYGRSHTMAGSSAVGAASAGVGTAGPYTQEAGFLGYNEICETTKTWTKRWDTNYMAPYAYNQNQWVCYDDEQSIAAKMELVRTLKLAGAFIWSIETDDFRGVCGQTFPLLKAVNKGLKTSGSTVLLPPARKQPSVSNTNCDKDGFFVNLGDCSRFYRCVGGRRHEFDCPAGLFFDQSLGVCNWPDQVNCQP